MNGKIIFNSEVLDPGCLACLLYSQTVREFSESRYSPILHDGPETSEDRMIKELNDNLWRDKYLPLYYKKCREAGITENYWIK